jgi:hypothetical protein
MVLSVTNFTLQICLTSDLLVNENSESIGIASVLVQAKLSVIIHNHLHILNDTPLEHKWIFLNLVESDSTAVWPGIMQKLNVICGISITLFDYSIRLHLLAIHFAFRFGPYRRSYRIVKWSGIQFQQWIMIIQ